MLRTRSTPVAPGWEKYHGTGSDLEAITTASPDALGDEPVVRDELADRWSNFSADRT